MPTLFIRGVGIACVVLIYRRLRNVSRFDVMYWAYTRTPIGKIVHGKQVAASHAKPAHSTGALHECGSFSVLEVPLHVARTQSRGVVVHLLDMYLGLPEEEERVV